MANLNGEFMDYDIVLAEFDEYDDDEVCLRI